MRIQHISAIYDTSRPLQIDVKNLLETLKATCEEVQMS